MKYKVTQEQINELIRLYVDEKLSAPMIRQRLKWVPCEYNHLSENWIRRTLKRNGITIRSPSEANYAQTRKRKITSKPPGPILTMRILLRNAREMCALMEEGEGDDAERIKKNQQMAASVRRSIDESGLLK